MSNNNDFAAIDGLTGFQQFESSPRISTRRNMLRLLFVVLLSLMIFLFDTQYSEHSHLQNHKSLTSLGTKVGKQDHHQQQQQQQFLLAKPQRDDTFHYPETIPQIAWIMSFGGSGTSYTIVNTESMSGTSTASNYGRDYDPCLSVHPESKQGPFIRSLDKPLPTSFILAKTHCGGYCMDCKVEELSIDQFDKACRSGKKRRASGEVIDVTYPQGTVQRAVHLVRDPFDNLVGRLHLAMKHNRSLEFSNDAQGLLEWCQYLNQSSYEKQKLPKSVQRFQHIPCFGEFFKYIQWHNLANAVTSNLNLPVHYLSYENYTHFDDTVDHLFQFLELDRVGKPVPWIAGKSYSEMFPLEVRKLAAEMMYELSTPSTWRLVRHYLEDNIDYSRPEVVWLMSFPNSGTSYTIVNVEHMTNSSTASNYAEDFDVLRPVRPELTNGPYLHKPYQNMRVPHFVLTKTHCEGYCNRCGPESYVFTLDSFENGCLRSSITDKNGERVNLHYDASVPKKAVHLFRSPFDNIVARFHLSLKQNKDFAQFTNTKKSFLDWCQFVDNEYARQEQESTLIPYHVKTLLDFPCHADFLRYAIWHNHAVDLTARMGISVLILHYEDYSSNFNSTVRDVLGFLDLPIVRSPLEFMSGKTYEDYYSYETSWKASQLVKAVANPAGWKHLARYFQDGRTSGTN